MLVIFPADPTSRKEEVDRKAEFKMRAGSSRAYHFAIGTAGSTALVVQTVLVPLMLADAPSRIVIEGGTHALSAPPFEFLAHTLLPVLTRMGPRLSVTLERHGFFPRGGGRIVLDIAPAPLTPIACIERGAFRSGKVEGWLPTSRSTSPTAS